MIRVYPRSTHPKVPGNPAHFTGQVEIETLLEAPSPSQVRVARVRFAPGARTHWHTHPLGQTLIVLEGAGWVQEEGGPKETIQEGDVVWIPPGVKHWHGATTHTPMVHLALQEAQEGRTVDWLEPVNDAQYQG
ncbi:MAG: cupin domain-containing protein [Meiothermus sp.]|uniref:(R)-mandelonitrile lyase n=1 Tax=Thermaceae TaxID=188786 RepID=UPI0026364C58|nr:MULTISPECIES: cupin domain-containing protein [Thermaceae]MCS7057993.1 cupin domain-containing protein [Meiothermus sp.]